MSNPPMFRAFAAEIQTYNGDSRQLTGRLVPYGKITWVRDDLPDGKIDVYQEGFKPGAFAAQVNRGSSKLINKIGLIHRHDGGLGYLGPFVALRDEPDGLYGDALVLPTKAADVGALIQAGIDELSVEFRLPSRLAMGERHTDTDATGVRWRLRAHLDGVALEPKGAYQSAQVIAYRQEIEDEETARAEQIKAEADRAAQEDAERQAAEAAAEEIKQRAEAEASAAIERRERFNQMMSRFDVEVSKQQDFVRTYLPADIRNR